MKQKIMNELMRIEKEKQVKILFAVESGRRAWGFPSKDSDYDVRFVYIHPIEWYLSIDEKRDVIEYPISNLLDISGWDIRKALKLFKKSNPSLMEWISSPIIYLEQTSFLNEMANLRDKYFSEKATIYHYLHMASGNYREYLQGEEVKIKKYFYALRPILACKWLENKQTLPPMEFEKLLETQVENRDLYLQIKRLLERKKSGEELDMEPKINIINNFLEYELTYYQDYVKNINTKKVDHSSLDILFRKILLEVWEERFRLDFTGQ